MKAFFLSRAVREKILMVALVVAAAAMWLSGAGKRAGKLWREVRNTSFDLKEQVVVLGQKDDIEARTKAAGERFDRSRTFDQVRLQSEINTIANAAGLGAKTNISGAPGERSNQLAVNSAQVSITGADYEAVGRFYTEVQKRAPYIGIEQFDLLASPPNSPNLRQTLRISSFEIAK
jgi:type II secretory pathway component PulK